jgi:hypothetical protein
LPERSRLTNNELTDYRLWENNKVGLLEFSYVIYLKSVIPYIFSRSECWKDKNLHPEGEGIPEHRPETLGMRTGPANQQMQLEQLLDQ